MPKGTRKVVFSFEESHLTHFGGMWLMLVFVVLQALMLSKYVIDKDAE